MRHEPAARLVTARAPQSPAAEAYRILRTNLLFTGLNRPLRSLMVTSAVPDEGKSLTAANLAVAFAQGGQRVLLVDADLRRPVQHRMFGLGRDAWGGLTEVLAGTVELQSAVAGTEITGLHVLPSGLLPPNPADLLGSQRMRSLMAALNEQFDLVIYDLQWERLPASRPARAAPFGCDLLTRHSPLALARGRTA